jgi:hypothetical protein
MCINIWLFCAIYGAFIFFDFFLEALILIPNFLIFVANFAPSAIFYFFSFFLFSFSCYSLCKNGKTDTYISIKFIYIVLVAYIVHLLTLYVWNDGSAGNYYIYDDVSRGTFYIYDILLSNLLPFLYKDNPLTSINVNSFIGDIHFAFLSIIAIFLTVLLVRTEEEKNTT